MSIQSGKGYLIYKDLENLDGICSISLEFIRNIMGNPLSTPLVLWWNQWHSQKDQQNILVTIKSLTGN